VCDAHGRPLGVALIPGQASELRAAPELLLLAAGLGTLRRVVGDAAYSWVAWFALAREAGALPVVRANPTHPQPAHFDAAAYRRRHQVENLWAKLKE
jgi:transposase